MSEKLDGRANKNEEKLYARREKLDPSFSKNHIIPTSQMEIDIVIPIIEKDLETNIVLFKIVMKQINFPSLNITN